MVRAEVAEYEGAFLMVGEVTLMVENEVLNYPNACEVFHVCIASIRTSLPLQILVLGGLESSCLLVVCHCYTLPSCARAILQLECQTQTTGHARLLKNTGMSRSFTSVLK